MKKRRRKGIIIPLAVLQFPDISASKNILHSRGVFCLIFNLCTIQHQKFLQRITLNFTTELNTKYNCPGMWFQHNAEKEIWFQYALPDLWSSYPCRTQFTIHTIFTCTKHICCSWEGNDSAVVNVQLHTFTNDNYKFM